METALMSNFGRKAAIAAAAFATVGSTLFGGAALASDENHLSSGPGGAGGAVDDTCSRNILPILSGNAISLTGDSAACNAAGGAGGNSGAVGNDY
jgi:hypothetical protein